MARFSIAQALASTATGLSVSDTLANIARALPDPAFVARVSSFRVNAPATASAGMIAQVAGLGAKLSLGVNKLTAQDSVAQLTDPANAPGLALASAVVVRDTADHLLAASGSALMMRANSVVLSSSASLTLAQIAVLRAEPSFSILAGQSLTLADTASNLLAVTTPQLRALISSYRLAGNATVTVATANNLVALAHFALDPAATLILSDTLDHLGELGSAVRAAATGIVVRDTVAHLLAAHELPAGVTGITALLDGGTYTVAQAVALLGLSGNLTLVPSGGATALRIADTARHIADASAALAALAADGPILATPNDQPTTLTAAEAAALTTSTTGLKVQDIGSALSDHANQIFGRGFASITVTAGTIAGTATQLLDTTLHYGAASTSLSTTLGQPAGTPSPVSAELVGVSVVDAAHLVALSVLPGFSVADGASLTVADTIAALIGAAGRIGAYATTVQATDSEVVTAANATALAGIGVVFQGTNAVTIADDAANIADPANATGVALARAVTLSVASIIDATEALVLTALGGRFSTSGRGVTVTDTADSLAILAGSAAAVNGWGAQVLLAADATLSVASAQALLAFNAFAEGTHHLTIADTAAHLLAAGASALALASVVRLSQPESLTVAAATALLGLHGFSASGQTVTIADTPAHLAAMPGAVAVWAGSEAIAAATAATTADYVLTAAQASALLALPHLTAFTGVTISDTADVLLAPASADVVAHADHIQLSIGTALSVSRAVSLVGLANYQTGAALTIADTLANLLHLGSLALPHNAAILTATAIALSEDAAATVAQLAALAALPQYAHLSLNGHGVTLQDSGRHLAGYVSDGVVVPAAYVLVGDATLTAAQASALAAHGVVIGDNVITVSDTPAALLDAGNAAGLGLAGGQTLSGDASVSATQAEALFARPMFNTGGHALTVVDNAASLLGLSGATDLKIATLALSASQTVDVATLLGLTQLGVKFSLNGHTLTVADTAAHLAALNTLETNLAAAEVLTASASLSAATAALLAALPNLSFGMGVTLTVVDTVANLSALSAAVQTIATEERLVPGTAVTLTVAQAQTLGGLGGFSNAGATIVVADTLSHLAAAGWQGVATSYEVADSAAALVAQAHSALLTGAAAVSLSGDTVIDTTSVAALAAIGHFSRGTAALVVADSPDAIAAHVADILAVASTARVISSSPLTAAEVSLLVPLANAGLLSFAGSNHLVVADSAAHLLDLANADGIALAAVVTITDTAANLVTAAAHDWGSLTPFYLLAANATVTGAEASVLAGLGAHFSNGGHTLAVADTAGSVIANAAALDTLSIGARVIDSIAHIGAVAGGLLALGPHLLSVQTTDVGAVDAADAAQLHGLAGYLTGGAIQVAGTVADLGANSADLLALGAHLGGVSVTPGGAAGAADVAGLLPLLAHLTNGTLVDVTDTAAAITARASGLAALGAVLGIVTLSDGTATDAATAAALLPVEAHLAAGVRLAVTDTIAAIMAAAGSLQALAQDGHLASISAPGETAAHLIGLSAPAVTALSGLGVSVSITDTAAHVAAGLDALQAALALISAIVLTDATTPVLSVSIAQLIADAPVLALITTGFNLSLSDTAAAIQADLTSGASQILAHAASLTSIVARDGGTVTLTQAQLLAAGLDDGPGAVLTVFSGGALHVTGVAVADIGTVVALPVVPSAIGVTDTAANIEADLTSGASALLAQRALISGIAATGGTVTLTEAQVLAQGVDDGGGSVLGKLTGASLAVIGVAVTDIPIIEALPVPPATIAIADSASAIQAGWSQLLARLTAISGVTVIGAGVITLTVAQIEGAGADNGPGSLIAKLSGGTVAVSGAAVSDLPALAALAVPPGRIAVTDTAAHVQADLAMGAGSHILGQLGSIASIAVTPSATITLTGAQLLQPGVDDGAQSALGLMTGAALAAADVAVGDIAAVLGLFVAPASLTVTDTAAAVAADLGSGASALLAHLAAITGIVVDGAVTLTAAQALTAHVDDGPGSVFALLSGGGLIVSGTAISDIGSLLALGVPPSSIGIVDSAADLLADLASGHSTLAAHPGLISGIALTDAGTPVLPLSIASLASDAAVLALLQTPFAIGISDTAAHIQADLVSAASVLVAGRASLDGITVSDGGTITLTAAQLLAVGVDDGPGSVVAHLSGGNLVANPVLIAELPALGGLAVAPGSFALADTAGHLVTDLGSGSSVVLAYLGAITSIVLTDSSAVHLSAAVVLSASVDDFAGAALAKIAGVTLTVYDAAVADIGALAGLPVAPAHIDVSDTAAHILADVTSGASVLAAHLGVLNQIAVSDGGALALTVAQIEAAGIDDGGMSVFSHLAAGTQVLVSGAAVADIDTLAGLGVVPDSIAISDTAAHIQADLASGSSHILAHLGRIGGIVVSDGGTITLTAAQALVAGVDDSPGSALAKTTGGAFIVTHALAAELDALAGLTIPPGSIMVVDTAAHIQADLTDGASQLLAHAGLVSGIAVSPGGTIVLTEAQVLRAGVDDSGGSALAKMTGVSLSVTDVAVADISLIAALGVAPASIAVSDTGDHVMADLTSGASQILSNLSGLAAIAVTPGGAIVFTEAQILAAGVDDGAGSALSKLSGATVTVAPVPVADVATILGLGVPPDHIVVVDSAANLIAGAATLLAHASAIDRVVPTEATLSLADATSLYQALHPGVTLDESGVTVADTAAALLVAGPAVLAAVGSVVMTDNPTGLTAADATALSAILGGHLSMGQTLEVVDTAANLLSVGYAAGMALATSVALSAGILSSASYVTMLTQLHGFSTGGQVVAIADTIAHLLDPAFAAGLAIATSIQPATDATVSAAELAALTAMPAFTAGGHAITVSDSAGAIVGLSAGDLGFVTQVAVVDTAANVSAQLNALQAGITAHAYPLSITLTDATPGTVAIIVTAATYSADMATLDSITAAGVVEVLGTAAQLVALASVLAADTVVGEVAVSDTAANILSNLTALTAIGAKFDSVSISDSALNAALVSGLLTVPHLNAGSFTISDTGSQIASAIQSTGAPGLAFLNAHTVMLSADSVVTASQALSLEVLTGLQKNGHTLNAWDTASHLTDSVDGYLAAVSAGIIDGVFLKTTGGTATVSASTAAALFSIPAFNKNNPNGSTNVLTVQDTAAHIESSFAVLSANAATIDHLVVSASATVTDAVFAHLLTLGATTALGAGVTVRDTAANIVGHAPAQLSGSPSLTPVNWALSGSAVVSVSDAAYLAGLTGFRPGASTLTLAADGSVSVAEANALGGLGATLRLGGRHVHVAGTVATVSGLSSAARAVVTPDITDTFAHIATLTIGSGLLGGTITVTDSAAPTVAQVTAFLALLQAGGITAARVFFGGHIETVTDTLAHLQALTGSANWIANPGVHVDFTLVAADTVAHLIDPANTAALAALAGTTLLGDQTVTAAQAQALVTVQSTIGFDLGGYTITIQDSAAHLLDPVNADGEALASVWRLSGNDTVSAADAEILLTEPKFVLNHTLVVSDSADNLLDGVLAGDIAASAYAASVHVQLAVPETLDAHTAAALVALPGFTNNGDLSIADSSDYLLNPANQAAEAAATSVNLVGDETVSAATAGRLAAVPHFDLGSDHLSLASNDYADAAVLTAIADFGSGFDPNGHTITLTQDAISLTPTEYAALQSDNIILNGHALSARATGVSVTSSGGTVHVLGSGVDGATLNVYAANGTSLSQTAGVGAAFDASASEGAIGNGVVVTETVGASAATSESAPIIALEQTVLTGAATAAGATFSGSGSVQVGVGQYTDLYLASAVPATPAYPALVYDPSAHTLSLDIAGHAPLVLVTLGTATAPATLDPSEIFIKHFV